MKSLYANRLGYIFLYLITFVWAAISSKSYLNDILFIIIFILFLIFFYYISYKRIGILSFSKITKKILFIWLLSPIIWMLLFWIIFSILMHYNIISSEILFLNNYIIFFPVILWFINIISFIIITVWKIDENNPISKEKDTIIKNKLFWPIYFSKKIKDDFIKSDSKKWWFEKIFYVFIIFIPITLLLSQINNELFYKKYIVIWNTEKIDIKTINSSSNLLEILKLDLETFNNINEWYVNKLEKLDLIEKWININEIENILILNNNTLTFGDIWNNLYVYNFSRNYNMFNKSNYIWDVYLVDNDLDYIYECIRGEECFIDIKKIKNKLFIDEDWIFIIIFYLISWFIFLKIFPNIFRIMYYIFLPFSVLFLLVKKYFWKLEEIEKKLKK